MQGRAYRYAYLYSGGTVTSLGSLGGNYSTAFGINNSGQIVGGSYLEVTAERSLSEHAFLYSGGVMQDLGSLAVDSSGDVYSAAIAINNFGEVVGYSTPTLGSLQPTHAFLYVNGVMIDLNSLLPAGSGWVLTSANAINDSGQIAGDGIINGQQHAFLLNTGTAVPEPASVMLFCAGAGAMLLSTALARQRALRRRPDQNC